MKLTETGLKIMWQLTSPEAPEGKWTLYYGSEHVNFDNPPSSPLARSFPAPEKYKSDKNNWFTF